MTFTTNEQQFLTEAGIGRRATVLCRTTRPAIG